MATEVLGFRGITKKLNHAAAKGHNLCEVDLFDEAPVGLRASGVSMEQRVPHIYCRLSGVLF